ncbi:MAG TPA: GspH/FimT family pseudopilin [Verrucomicrobiae bacterium]|jgi:prepilin-type N-terminal cleavage/methylation domain-containing protein|nr:GspH/FimT family pseudopilin [Verrucomicrobiae bacterium]
MTNDKCRSANSRHSLASPKLRSDGGSFVIRHSSSGFTLIEMILVLALLVIAVSFVAPHLSGFFRGRTLNSEAKQIVALMHEGQSRAVSGGVPMVLWFDAKEQKYGLEEEPGYNDKDPDAVEFKLNENLQIEIPDDDPSTTVSADTTTSTDSARAGLPQISFLPDGTIAETSPQTIKVVDPDTNKTLSLTQTRDRNQYEIATTTSQ